MHGGSDDEAPEAQRPKDLFVVHKLSKLDTLAGLAIKYNVAVADIKRTNSLLSDSAMFARDTLLIPTRPLPMGQEYSAWAGLIVTQYGQVSRNHQDRPMRGYSGSGGPEDPSQTAIAQLRAHYGLSPASSPTAGRAYAHSEDGFSSGRPSEVEMQDMGNISSGSGGGIQRRPSLPELNSYAGERHGPPAGDERLRRRRAGDEVWGSQDSASGSGALHAGHILPPAGPGGAAHLSRQSPSRLGSSGAGPSRAPPRQQTGSPVRQASGGASGVPPGRRRESFLDKIKRAASQPALAAPPGPSLGRAAESTIASIRKAPPELGARGVLHDAAAALQGPKAAQKKE